MTSNERGGILSKLFIVPVGVALMVGFFFLGYYVGKYQSKSITPAEVNRPLPDLASKNAPKQEEFTFYKTLTDKENKTVSIDLKPRSANDESTSGEKRAAAEAPKQEVKPAQKEKRTEVKIGKNSDSQPSQKEAVLKKPQVRIRKEAVIASSTNSKIRYTIQIAAYQEKGMAEDDVKKMKKAGYAAFIVSSELPGKGTWHRVRIGSFSNKTSAEHLQKEIHAKAGVSPILVIE